MNFRFLLQDVMVLNDIIDQVSERPQSKATHLSSAYQVGMRRVKCVVCGTEHHAKNCTLSDKGTHEPQKTSFKNKYLSPY
jgi:hypothetical protein